MNLWLLVFGLAALMAGAWTYLVWRGFSQDWLPPELETASVVMVEKQMACEAPYPVVGRFDQVYKTGDGLHVPVEGKNRDTHRVFQTDVAQLSLQAWLLRRNGYMTAPYGFVAVNSRVSGGRKAIKVDLLGELECEKMVTRFLAVRYGKTRPIKSLGPKCRSCGHKARCQSTGT